MTQLPSEQPNPGNPASPTPDVADSLARTQEISKLFREHNRALVNFVLSRVANEQEAKERGDDERG